MDIYINIYLFIDLFFNYLFFISLYIYIYSSVDFTFCRFFEAVCTIDIEAEKWRRHADHRGHNRRGHSISR